LASCLQIADFSGRASSCCTRHEALVISNPSSALVEAPPKMEPVAKGGPLLSCGGGSLPWVGGPRRRCRGLDLRCRRVVRGACGHARYPRPTGPAARLRALPIAAERLPQSSPADPITRGIITAILLASALASGRGSSSRTCRRQSWTRMTGFSPRAASGLRSGLLTGDRARSWSLPAGASTAGAPRPRVGRNERPLPRHRVARSSMSRAATLDKENCEVPRPAHAQGWGPSGSAHSFLARGGAFVGTRRRSAAARTRRRRPTPPNVSLKARSLPLRSAHHDEGVGWRQRTP